ncbi:nucleotidyl transferase AbiEii/AbiGii toxin family protein [Solitalea lacus]|uniref:nucleotidyl transferase AbiEii/AbiGii toxin family protein n=1 Tax=Solitalea lacus TaxID=2911172 RepID=UPI001EDA146B|nr:nucleotidyl transferase AbiEii/AbiGii toxin family protein [Solitalea lacus]UKJ07283.1 hypothetical protein L2B55_17380 [Solitalea lacus]
MRHNELKHIFDILEKAFESLGIDYYLIGALARQVWYEKADVNFRTTKDVDYAALIGSHEEYDRVKEYLITNEGFTEHRGNAFVLISPDGIQVDILPFGEIENGGSVDIRGTGMTSIRVDGMKEVYKAGTEIVEFETGNVFKVATLPSIALLKFIAYDDRPEQRQKDVLDITNLLKHFFNLNSELIYNDHNDLFDEEKDRSLENISAIVIGREMRKIATSNESLIKRLESIMNKHIELNEKSPFIRLMIQGTGSNVEEMTDRLRDIQWGFNNKSQVFED